MPSKAIRVAFCSTKFTFHVHAKRKPVGPFLQFAAVQQRGNQSLMPKHTKKPHRKNDVATYLAPKETYTRRI